MTKLELLSSCEAQVLGLASLGKSDQEIASIMQIPYQAVVAHWMRMVIKLGKPTREDLIVHWRANHGAQSRRYAIDSDSEEFACLIFRDLREPLLTVSGFASMLQEELRPVMSPEQIDHFAHVISGCKRMSQLIEAHLSLSRVPVPHFEYQASDLKGIVSPVLPEETGASSST